MTLSLKYYSPFLVHHWSREGLLSHEPYHVTYGSLKVVKLSTFLFLLGIVLTCWGFVCISNPKPLPMGQFSMSGGILKAFYNFTGYSPPTLQLSNQALDEEHPLHYLFPPNLLNYTYGSHNKLLTCQRVHPPSYVTLPSILRSLSFYHNAQTLMRIALLLAFHVRIHLCWSVTGLAAIQKNTFLAKFFCVTLPVLEIPWMIFAMFILMFHHSIDKEWSFLFDKNISIFGVLFGMYASAYIVFTIVRNKKDFLLLVVRVFCLSIFLSTIFSVQKSYLTFMKEKPCHTLVEYNEALIEYAAFFSIFLFLSTQLVEMKNFIVVISSVPNENVSKEEFNELIGCFWQNDYYPVYLFNT
ncbi:unnamed protein product [Auanema sp. JU1783]|nr:unnamed protein product [Auanema sp. JU1783]